MDIKQFLGHSNKAGGNRQKVLGGWRDKDPFAVTIWLHTKAPILALWRHPWARIVVREDRQTKETKKNVWADRLVCFEDEEVLKKQHWRDKQTGERDEPPRLCPHCKLIEYVRREVREGRLSWVAPVFRFAGADDPKENRIIHAGGLYNAFGAKDLTAEQKKRMAAVAAKDGGPIYAKDAWKQNSQAKLEYVFAVVNNDDLQGGVQIAIESQLLGDKTKEVIAKAIKALGEEEGHPHYHPYAIRWEYNPSEGIEFNKKYDALRMEKLKLSPAVQKLIVDESPPDFARLVEKFNPKTHRANLERAALVELPWDELFADAEAWVAEHGDEDKEGDEPPAIERAPEVGSARVPAQARERQQNKPAANGEAVFVDGEEVCACDDCGRPVKLSAPACPHCGKRYVVDAEPAQAVEEKPNLRSRAEVKAEMERKKAADLQAAQGGGSGSAQNNADDDDIPF